MKAQLRRSHSAFSSRWLWLDARRATDPQEKERRPVAWYRSNDELCRLRHRRPKYRRPFPGAWRLWGGLLVSPQPSGKFNFGFIFVFLNDTKESAGLLYFVQQCEQLSKAASLTASFRERNCDNPWQRCHVERRQFAVKTNTSPERILTLCWARRRRLG